MERKIIKQAITSTTTILVIPSKKATLSDSQKAYNRYIKEIDKKKSELKKAKKEIDKLKRTIHVDVFPEMDTLQELRLKRLEKIDEFFEQRVSKNHSNGLYNVFFAEISLIVAESNLYPVNQEIMEKVIQLHDKHATISYEEIINQANKKALEQVKFDEENSEIDDINEEFAEKNNKDKKQEKNEQAITLKTIYKRLVKQLHPDLEADTDKQVLKNELMQRTTRAYTENDFFELLKLDIEYQTKNKSGVSNLADQEIEYYNQLLKSQIQGLKMNIKALKSSFLYDYYGGSSQHTKQIIKQCKEKIDSEKKDYQQITTAKFGSLKGWKKSLKYRAQENDDSNFALIFGGNNQEMNYKERMDFLYGKQRHNSF
jgi:hypothetical protein